MASVFMVLACTESSLEKGNLTGGAIRISPLLTRVTDVDFEDGDQIGLSIQKGAEMYSENVLMTYSGNVFSSSLVWYPETEVTSDFIAYYPYDEAGMPSSFSVESDQSSGISVSDLVVAVKKDVKPSSEPVLMTFKHLLSKIILNITNETGSEISAVFLAGSKLTADLSLVNQLVTVSQDAPMEDIKAMPIEAGSRYALIVIPQEAAFTLSVSTADSKVYTQELESVSLKQGGQYTITAKLTEASGLQIKIAGEVEGWTDEGEIGPGTGGTDPSEGEIEYAGETYRTVTLSNGSVWMAEPLRYIPSGMVVSSDPADNNAHIWYPYKNDGAGNAIAVTDEAAIKSNGYLYDFYAAFGGTEITADNYKNFEGTQGICPDGWHIPTRAELFALCGNSNKAEGETGIQVNEDALFFVPAYNGGKVTAFNDAGWNYVLSGLVQNTSLSGTGKYGALWISESNSNQPQFYGCPSLTYIMSSTCYNLKYSSSEPDELDNIQFFGMMTTFSSTYSEGRASLSYISIRAGVQLRCVKNAE